MREPVRATEFSPSSAPLGRVQRRFRQQLERKLRDGTYSLELAEHCLCRAGDAREVASADRFGVPIHVLACTSCGLLRNSPRLAPRSLPGFYEAEYHGLHFGVAEPQSPVHLVRPGQGSRIYEYVRPWLPSHRHLFIAEVGAGSGTVLRELESAARRDARQATVWGCEYASSFVAFARSAGTDVRAGGLEVLVPAPGPLDLLVMSHVLEHFPDPEHELAQLRPMLNFSALIYVEVPGLLTIHRKPEYAFAFSRYLTVAHMYHFTLATLTDLMERSGYQRVAGDEEVRSLFRLRSDGNRTARSLSLRHAEAGESRFDALMRYLAYLDRSPGLRLRRWWVIGRGGVLRPVRRVRHRLVRLLRPGP